MVHLRPAGAERYIKDGREAQRYRRWFGDEPGAMLFHRRQDGKQTEDEGQLLLMVLVPESPTYGINTHAAQEAESALNLLVSHGFSNEMDDRVAWVGPNFSASASSLFTLVNREKYLTDAFSGSLTYDLGVSDLEAIDDVSGERVVTAPELDEISLEQLLRTLQPDRVARLQEDESSYGGQDVCSFNSVGGCEIVATYRFPRGVSHVRGIFGRQLTNFKPSQGDGQQTSDQKHLFDFGDSLQQPLDTAPEFAAQSSYSNEGELSEIATSLQHSHSKILIILATDPLGSAISRTLFPSEDPRHAIGAI